MNDPDPSLIGVACLVWWRGALVLEMQKPHKWRIDDRRQTHIGLGCIGGTINEGETAVDALQREALEEMGCRVALHDATATYAISPDCRVQPETWPLPAPRPALVWEACLPGLVPGKRVAVYRGRALAKPFPGDLPALLFVTPQMLLAIGNTGISLAGAQQLGATLQARTAIPGTARLELVGTPAVLSLLHARNQAIAAALLEAVEGTD